MAHFEQHCRDCELILGERHEDVNRWIDELFRQYGANHREHRHHWRGVWDTKGIWGEEGAKAAIVHIVRDCGAVPSARSYEKTNLGIVVAPAFLLGPATEQSEKEFRQAVKKAMKKAHRDGILAGSLVVKPTADNRESVGSIPTPPTKIGGSMSQQAEVNGRMHDVCESCGSVVGHGCPDSEPCDCGEEKPEYKDMNGVCCK